MREFFHGWRRKAGCFTLTMALALSSMWLRSSFVFDILDITPSEQRCQIASACGMIFAAVWHEDNPSYRRNGWQRIELSGLNDPEATIEVALYSWQNFDWHIPYRSLILPLTLLSAYLILWKPRKRERRVNSATPNS